MKNNILIGISGGIAAYKMPGLVRLFVKNGYNVKVVLTDNARLFVTRETIEVLSGNDVYSDELSDRDIIDAIHIELSKWADVILIAPATFNTIGKIASGIADNLLTSVVAASDHKKIVLSPSMNVNMWDNPILKENLKKLNNLGINEINPGKGYLACGDTGEGRLPDIEIIFAHVKRHLEKDNWFMGKKYIVTAGGTEEDIDPVRVISNKSSGKMGIEIAKQLFFKGADVLVIKGRTDVSVPKYINYIEAKNTKSMLNSMEKNISENTRIVMAAAVSDFVVKNKAKKKFHKDELKTIELKDNIDIIKSVSRKYAVPIIGFALENGIDMTKAKRKLKEKKLNAIIVNDVSAIGSENSKIRILKDSGDITEEISGTKEKVAEVIVSELRNI